MALQETHHAEGESEAQAQDDAIPKTLGQWGGRHFELSVNKAHSKTIVKTIAKSDATPDTSGAPER